MKQSLIKVSAPGSLMLLGEHAVLHGRRALVCAIDQRISVELFPFAGVQGRQPLEQKLKIESDLGAYEAPLAKLADHPDFRFVLDVVKQYPLEQGIELKITSDFSSDIGFGSSAAVTVATHAALGKLCFGSPGRFAPPSDAECLGRATPPAEPSRLEIFKRSLATIHRVQGRGSGADIAASVFGGVVAYRADPLEISPMCEELPLMAVYSGSKMKTVDVIRYLEEKRALNADYFEKIFDRMDASIGEVIENCPLRESSGQAMLGKNLILNQKLMEEMGLCNAALAEIIQTFQTLEIPAKISGSGLGDCAIGLAEPAGLRSSDGPEKPFGHYPTYALNVTTQGVRVSDEYQSPILMDRNTIRR